MAQREWVEKDFYKELGVASDAGTDEIKKAYRKLASELHPDKNPNNPSAEERFKRVSEAHSVLSDEAKRKEYDETRRLFAGGGFGRRAGAGAGGNFGGFGTGGDGTEFNLNDLFDAAGQTGGNNIGDLFGGLFGRGAQPRPSRAPARKRPGDRDRTRLPGSHQGCRDAVAAHQPRAVHQLPRQWRPAGHQPEGLPELQRRRCGQPEPGRVRVLRALHRMPGQRLDHRAPV